MGELQKAAFYAARAKKHAKIAMTLAVFAAICGIVSLILALS